MVEIKVYGPGCARCKQTEKVVRMAVEASGVEAKVEKVEDLVEMAKAGILTTPAVTVDGTLKATGRIPEPEEIRGWLAAAAAVIR
jgi:small redox-active disulfide protein 2